VKYRLVIFDFDGTLADTFPWLMSILDQIADKFKFEVPGHQELEAMRTIPAKDMMKKYNVSLWKMFSMSRYVHKIMAEDIQNIQLFPGIENLLKELHNLGISLALVSSNSYDNVCRVFGPEIASIFDHYECGVSILGKGSKFKHIVKKNKISPKNVLCIGDEVRDFEAARKAGMDFGAVSWGYTKVEALRDLGPEITFDCTEEIVPAIIGA
jgi:phosphoglycolate phosphatase